MNNFRHEESLIKIRNRQNISARFISIFYHHSCIIFYILNTIYASSFNSVNRKSIQTKFQISILLQFHLRFKNDWKCLNNIRNIFELLNITCLNMNFKIFHY